MVTQHGRKTHKEFNATSLKVKIIMAHKQTIISSAIAMNVFNIKILLIYIIYKNLHIPMVDEKREPYVELLVKRSKVNLPATFGRTYFLNEYLNTSWSVFLPTLYTDSGWWKKDAQKVLDKLSLIKVRKGRCPKALDNFADFSVSYQLGRFTYAFCYQFLTIFRCFGIFPLDRTVFSAS